METSGDVVALSVRQRVAFVTMNEREGKNTFTERMIYGLQETFERIRRTEEVSVVVISGYDSYFCCGGTQEELLRMQAGRLRFSELSFYRLLLDCDVPVVAAMQGHAIGGGLVFGAYADLVVLAQEAVYSANFMKFGFTPGFGATFIIPEKFGVTLGTEMLLTGETYSGGNLRSRGAPMRIVPRREVLDVAGALARGLTQTPRCALQVLKRHWREMADERCRHAVECETRMQDATFNRAEVRQLIEERFGEGAILFGEGRR